MIVPRGIVVFCIALVLGQANIARAAGSGEENPVAPSIRIELEAGLLTLDTHVAPLDEVLHEIGTLAGFSIIRVADFIESPLVNALFENRPVREVVEHLVVDTNRIIFYAIRNDGAQQRIISQIWLLGPGGPSGGEQAQDAEEDIVFSGDLQHVDGKIRSEAVLRLTQQTAAGLLKKHDGEPVLAKLARVLREDQDSLVRARAAMALGALRNERSVPDLQSALSDGHSSVRSQAITALGQIGGEGATMVLGNILLDTGINKIERVLAAQALWKQDSESARGYLRAGTNDMDEQVRLASSKAPSYPAEDFTTEQHGPEETE